LLAELKYVTDSYWKSEELGERRLTFFITVAAAVMGGLVTMEKDAQVVPTNPLGVLGAAFGAVTLWLLGLVTIRRMQRRNEVRDDYRRAADKIRIYFGERSFEVQRYMPFDPTKSIPPRARRGSRLGRGGLLETAILMTSLAAATAAAAMTFALIKIPRLASLRTWPRSFAATSRLHGRAVLLASHHRPVALG
jgi:hypothetical protein